MDRVLIDQKLETLRYCIARIAEKCPGQPEQLESDADLQDIIVLNLTRSIQLCVDIASHLIAQSDESAPMTMGDALSKLAQLGILDDRLATKLRQAVGFRNIAVHNYDKVDWAIVHAICSRRLDDFRQFALGIEKQLNR